MDRGYQALTSDDENLFEFHSAGINKAIRETFSSIPANFQLKPVTIRKQQGCGTFYDLKIALPDGQFAKVSFHTGGYPLPRTAGSNEKPKEQHFDVDPTPSASQYE